MLLNVWVDLGLMPTVLGGHEFRGCLMQKSRRAVVVSVERERVKSLDCATGDVIVRSVDDANSGRVPFIVYEYALDVVKRLVSHVNDDAVIVGGDLSEFEKVRDEARRLVKVRDPLPLDGFGTMLREHLNESSKQFEEAFDVLSALEHTALEDGGRDHDWLFAFLHAIKLGRSDDAWRIWRWYQTYTGTPVANQYDRSAAVSERDRIVAGWSA